MEVRKDKITNLQQELMRVFSYNLTEQELEEVRALLSNHFAEKATQEMDKLWDENGWSDNTMENWLKEHHRTSIRSRFSFDESRKLLEDYKGSFSDAVIEERNEQ